jgi:hypothetical protein
MRIFARPVRFLAMIVALWIGGRIWWLLPPGARDAPPRPAPRVVSPPTIVASTPGVAPARKAAMGAPLPRPTTASPDANRPSMIAVPAVAPIPALSPPVPVGRIVSVAKAGVASLPPVGAVVTAPSRWSGSAYLFVRNGGGDTALAANGQLGGGQAGARIAWRVNRDGPTRIALAARFYAPLDARAAAEAAAGVDIHPLPGRPLRLSVERRFDVGGGGRNSWSAYAAGGFWREIGKGVELDGYAQAGVVGAHAGDLFGDGALRLAARQNLGEDIMLRLGGGAWAGAQPGVERLDIGPRVALGLPIGQANITAAIEGRFRIAGQASPGSGVALTLATDF